MGNHQYSLYRLGGKNILFNRPVVPLQPFISEVRPTIEASVREWEEKWLSAYQRLIREKGGEGVEGISIRMRNEVIRAKGWIGGGLSIVSVYQFDDGYVIEIPKVGGYIISLDGSCVFQVWEEPGANQVIIDEALLGPPLVLSLVKQEIWCMHGSAVQYKDKLVGFLGDTGVGKSTLADFLSGQQGIKLLVDDILPVEWESSTVKTSPQFPQLKLPLERQPGVGSPDRLQVAALYSVEVQPEISIQGLRPYEAAQTMIRNTVGARLFDRRILEQHLEFCSLAASSIPVRHLAYPHQYGKLDQVWDSLRIDLEEIYHKRFSKMAGQS